MAAGGNTPTEAAVIQNEAGQEGQGSTSDCWILEDPELGRNRAQLAPRASSISSN
jgi:hypothetical protein